MKNVQSYKQSSINWKIESKAIDTYEISQTDTQHEYIVYVKDASGQNVDGALAYGLTDRTKVTKDFISKYGTHIDIIEHQE